MGTDGVTLYIATSVDGYIADEEGGVDWLDEFRTESDGDGEAEGFSEFFRTVDCLVMGSTTYEQVLGFGEWPYEDRPTYVLTHRDLTPATEGVRFVDGAIAALVPDLRRQYDHVWVVGGAELAQSFLRAHEIDAVRLSLVPILLGDGVRLFSGEYSERGLRLLDTTTRDSGVVEHHYAVLETDGSR